MVKGITYTNLGIFVSWCMLYPLSLPHGNDKFYDHHRISSAAFLMPSLLSCVCCQKNKNQKEPISLGNAKNKMSTRNGQGNPHLSPKHSDFQLTIVKFISVNSSNNFPFTLNQSSIESIYPSFH